MGAAALTSRRRLLDRLHAEHVIQGWKVWIEPLSFGEGWRVSRVDGGGLAYSRLDDAIAVAKLWLRADRVKNAVPYA